MRVRIGIREHASNSKPKSNAIIDMRARLIAELQRAATASRERGTDAEGVELRVRVRGRLGHDVGAATTIKFFPDFLHPPHRIRTQATAAAAMAAATRGGVCCCKS